MKGLTGLEMAILAFAILLIATIPFALRAHGQTGLDVCSFERGGSVDTCAAMARRHPHAGEAKTDFHSAGILALERARCVDPESTWSFHGSYVYRFDEMASNGDIPKEVSPYGSGILRNSLWKYPALVRYLDARGVWSNVGGDFVTFTGAELGRFGVPQCR